MTKQERMMAAIKEAKARLKTAEKLRNDPGFQRLPLSIGDVFMPLYVPEELQLFGAVRCPARA